MKALDQLQQYICLMEDRPNCWCRGSNLIMDEAAVPLSDVAYITMNNIAIDA